MTLESNIASLLALLDELLALLDTAADEGSRSAKLFADGVRIRRGALRQTAAGAEPLPLVPRLLDIVPDAKDLDAVDFRLDRYPEIRALRSRISIDAARLAQDLLAS